MNHENPVLNIASGRTPPSRRCAQTPRRAGVWNDLCLAALRREATPDGEPVRDETGAIGCILSHCGDVEAEGGAMARRMLDALGAKATAGLLAEFGREGMTQDGWKYWRHRLDLPLRGKDDDPKRFLDGWMPRWAMLSGPHPAPDDRRPGEIPHTEEDEKIVWECRDGEVVGPPY